MNLKLGLTQSRLTDLLHEMTSQCMHTRENTKTSQYQLARGADATCYPGTNIIVIQYNNALFTTSITYTSSKQSQCSLSGFNLTIWEQRPLWKTEFMAVFCFTGVKSFSVPKKTKNNLKSKSVKGSFCVQRCGSLKSRETSKLIYLPVEHTSNAEENIELSRCGSLADNLSHTNTKLSSAVRNLKNISWDNFHL